ncbi:MAG: glycerol-3-phosphate dehydrogenase/oxidase [Chloroflexi bacterium]|nr:glycerol-3-phosphate dehydrogenase/oxidase [Chloroflexota bacterium]
MEWTSGWRENAWNELNRQWDTLIIGGGITGAGILRQCVHAGLKAVLVEADDFASGTSSRSSKLVHGGMRYLKNAQVRVTLESVTEREYLLKQGRGLVSRLGFLYPCLDTDHMPGWVFGAGLVIYDLMAKQWSHRSYDAEDMRELCPILTTPAMHSGFRFFDAQTDDARLVLRLIRESVNGGALALNYARVTSLLKTKDGQVCGAVVRDTSGGSDRETEVRARVAINAAGAWADELRSHVNRTPRLRPLRGSHLVFKSSRIPLTRSVSFSHPKDGRPVFILPWEGAVIYGTTDVDQGQNLITDPSISSNEAEYLLDGLKYVFPALELTFDDVIATFSGIRPVVDTGKANPSKESREHVIWDENGLLTVSGGKLTTFRIMARDALKAVRRRLGYIPFDPDVPVLDPLPPEAEGLLAETRLPASQCLRLLARYGVNASTSFCKLGEDMDAIPGTNYVWAELRQAAHGEGVVHLDDLLLRRVRLGFLVPNGGLDQMDRIRAIVQPELDWDDQRWAAEEKSYVELWRSAYRL